jgi:AcrR family transcriptional regulator
MAETPSASRATGKKAAAKAKAQAAKVTRAKPEPRTAKSPAKATPPHKAAKAAAKPSKSAAVTKPHGREQVTESIINATLSLWTAQGPSELSLRSIAARAGVNYGLVHRHFGTKEAVIRAAMDAVVIRSLGFIEDSTDLMGAIDNVLPRSTGAHARLVAWSILQYVEDDVLPEDDLFLGRLRKLATANISDPEDQIASAVTAGSLIAMLYGWRLFESYISRGLGLQKVPHDKLDALIRSNMLALIEAQPGLK